MNALRLLRTNSSITPEGKRKQPRMAAIMTMVTVFAVGTTARADDGISDEAKEHFRSGVTLLQDPDGARYEEAYREFKAAYALSPSPKILGNLGYAALKLERDRDAIDAYERYLREAPDIGPDERRQVQADLQTLKTGLVRVTLDIELPGGVITDRRLPVRGEPIVNSYGTAAGRQELGIRSGRHVIEVRFPQGEPQVWQFDAMPGSRLTHDFALPRAKTAPAEQRQPSRTVPLILVSTGAVMLAAGAITGYLALDKKKDIERSCPNDTCPAGYGIDGQRSSAYTLVRATDALLIGGGVVAATGLGWLLFSRKPTGGAPAAMAACSGNGCGAAISGRF